MDLRAEATSSPSGLGRASAWLSHSIVSEGRARQPVSRAMGLGAPRLGETLPEATHARRLQIDAAEATSAQRDT